MFKHIINNCLNGIQKCSLCGASDHRFHGLCEGCHADLPWLIHACPRCALPLSRYRSGLCPHCSNELPAFDKVQAAFTYSFPLSQLIPAIKYQRQPAHLGWLAATLSDFIRQRHEGRWPDALIPVPMHPFSQIYRGYNQAELLAQRLSHQLHIPLQLGLRKHRRTPKQMSLSLEARRRNLQDSFTVRSAAPEYVALIDDVMTTGTTVSTLARLLREHGCKRVDVWVLARTPENH